MPTTKRLTLDSVIKALTRNQTKNTELLGAHYVSVRTPSVTATNTFSLLFAETDLYLAAVRFIPDTAFNATDWSIQVQNESTDGTGSTAIGDAFTGAGVAQDGAAVYAPADPKTTVVAVGEVISAVCTRTAGTLDGTWQLCFIPILD